MTSPFAIELFTVTIAIEVRLCQTGPALDCGTFTLTQFLQEALLR